MRMRLIEKIKIKLRGTINLEKLCRDGLIVGDNFHAMEGVIIDPGHCWLIEIGNNVTLAPRVHILAHDASSKIITNYTKIGQVIIGDNVFIGASSIILPNVKIESNTIIGAGSVVSRNLTSGVWAGNPCHKIFSYDEYVEKQMTMIQKVPCYDKRWTYGQITNEMKKEMKESISDKGGYVV
jgi:maltose O-acetyltransferase